VEAETLVEECVALAAKDGPEARADAVGARLKELARPRRGSCSRRSSRRRARRGEEGSAGPRADLEGGGRPTATLKAVVKRAATALGELVE